MQGHHAWSAHTTAFSGTHRAQNWNDNPQPFAWTQTADDIIAKVKRGRAALTKTATHH